ncbi:glucosyltransferase domain-containing protein [Vibrio echinoideorum]|uniref:glucosyltransferase domain-containing protein n=1 Tax=Vibrio echinoideorum TaxID=2100116 RepID=UPI003550056D
MTPNVYFKKILLKILPFLLCLIYFGWEIFNFNLSIDEELHSFGMGGWQAWLKQGRWGMSLLVFLLPEHFSVVPFLPTFTFSLLTSVALIRLVNILKLSDVQKLLFIVSFLSTPIWAHIVQFGTLSWGVGIGFLMTTISIELFLKKEGGYYKILSAMLLAFSVSIYQGLVVFQFILLFFIISRDHISCIESRNGGFKISFIYDWIKLFLFVVFSILIYVVISKLTLVLANYELAYISSFIDINALLHEPLPILNRGFDNYVSYFNGSHAIYLSLGVLPIILFWSGVAGGVLSLFLKNNCKLIIYLIVLVLAFSLSSALLVLVSAGSVPARSLVYIPIVIGLVSTLTVVLVGKYNQVIYILTALTILGSAYINISLFYSDQIERDRDKILATRLMVEFDSILKNDPRDKYQLVIIGSSQSENSGISKKIEVFGSSFFGHDGGNIVRIHAYFNYLGENRFSRAYLSEYTTSIEKINDIPVWPKSGSVFLHDDIVVVKLGELSYSQKLRLEESKK